MSAVKAKTKNESAFRMQMRDLMRSPEPKTEENGFPPLGRYRLKVNQRGLGACFSVEGPAVNAHYDALAALGLHPRPTGLKDNGQPAGWRFLLPVARWETSPLLRAKLSRLIAGACNAPAHEQIALDAVIAQLEGRHQHALALAAEAELRRTKLHHRDAEAQSPEGEPCS